MHLSRSRLEAIAIILICLSLILATLYIIQVSGGADGDSEYRLATERLFKEVSSGFEQFRGLSLGEGFDLKIVTADWVEENWARGYVESAAQEIELEEEIYKSLFLVPQDVNLSELRVREAIFLAAAWKGDIYVVQDYFNPFDEMEGRKVFAHEFTHLAQAKHFASPDRHTHDGRQTWVALIEGDAEFTGKEYVGSVSTALSVISTAGSPAESFLHVVSPVHPLRAQTPDSLQQIWRFPGYGIEFVKTLFDEGGWERVNEVYKDPPSTTEQIMHPQRYLSGEGFIEVDAPPITGADWVVAKTDRFGEHFVFVVLNTHVPREDAARAAEGWGGDNFTYYKWGNDYLFTWRIVWDTERDAAEFTRSLAEMMDQLSAEEIETSLWRVQERYICLKKSGGTTLLIGSSVVEEVARVSGYGQ